MHIPDGFIADPRIWGGCFAVALPALAIAARRSRAALDERATLLSGMTGAFLFAAQMFNFPVAGGTSGHLLGGTLACALLGGPGGMLVLSLVLTLQCLLFQDGGITALGANILNMAVIGGGGGYLLYWLLAPLITSQRIRLFLLGVTAGLGVLVSAALAALEIGFSGVVPVPTALLAMITVHIPIAIVEGLATTSVVGAIERMRPDLTRGFHRPAIPVRSWLPVAASVVVLAVLAVAFASASPDGLEHAAQQLGFESRAAAAIPAPFPDYEWPARSSFLARTVVALAGLGVTAVLAGLLTRLIRRSGDAVRG